MKEMKTMQPTHAGLLQDAFNKWWQKRAQLQLARVASCVSMLYPHVLCQAVQCVETATPRFDVLHGKTKTAFPSSTCTATAHSYIHAPHWPPATSHCPAYHPTTLSSTHSQTVAATTRHGTQPPPSTPPTRTPPCPCHDDWTPPADTATPQHTTPPHPCSHGASCP